MSKRSKIATDVPEHLQEELNARLVKNGFSNYQGLTTWLNQELAKEGLEIRVGKSSTARYGMDFQEQFERDMSVTRQMVAMAKTAVAENVDTKTILQEVASLNMSSQMITLSSSLREAGENGDDIHLMAKTSEKITTALSALVKQDILSQKHKLETAERTLSIQLETIKKLFEFVTKSFPQHKAVLAEILEPFGQLLSHGNG